MKLLYDLFGQPYEARIFYILGYIFQSDRCLVFGLLNLSVFFIYDQYYSASFEDLYSRKCRRCLHSDYCSVNLRALPIVLHILISIIPVHVPFLFNLPLIEIARTQFFVRWMDCNTPLPEYVLSCVFRFFDHIFRFTSYIFLFYDDLYDRFALDLDSWTQSQP